VGRFDDFLDDFSDQSIDLLHIDGCHTYEAARHDFETWLPKVKPGGVILLHDINVTRPPFGVYRLWEELTQKYPWETWPQEHGMGILYV
jgi:predicted O-methyltransferase YrrM